MREIKFRAWDGEGMFFGGFAVHATGSLLGDLFLKDKPFDVMQYTGLKDKNGKDIYEGDFVVCGTGDPQDVELVCYQAPSFVMKNRAHHRTWREFTRGPDHNQFQEVIGNIHNDPDLLNVPSSEVKK